MKIYQHKVHYYETDKMGIVHHSNYIRWMEEARIDFLDQIGWSYAKLEEEGIISPVTGVECRYKANSFFGDVISVIVQVEEFKGVKLKMKYLMKNEKDVVVCEGHSEHCFVNPQGMILRLKKEHPAFCEVLMNYAELTAKGE